MEKRRIYAGLSQMVLAPKVYGDGASIRGEPPGDVGSAVNWLGQPRSQG
jgi:hypothetical protein